MWHRMRTTLKSKTFIFYETLDCLLNGYGTHFKELFEDLEALITSLMTLNHQDGTSTIIFNLIHNALVLSFMR